MKRRPSTFRSHVLHLPLLLIPPLLWVSCTQTPLAPDTAGSTAPATTEDGVPRVFGSLPDDEAVLATNHLDPTLYGSFPSHAATPPMAVDLSSNMPPVGDQGRQGSCVGWASAYALKSSQEFREEGWSLGTSNHLFSPAWIYNQINGGWDGGSLPSDALRLLVAKGADTLDHFPYDDRNCTRRPDAPSMNRALRFKALRWAAVPNDTDKIRKLVAAGRALLIAIDVYPSFMNLTAARPVYQDRSGRLLGGHALCLMGYDDGKRAFKFINSWGTRWGDRGYGWLTYDFVKEPSPVHFRAYVLYDRPNGP